MSAVRNDPVSLEHTDWRNKSCTRSANSLRAGVCTPESAVRLEGWWGPDEMVTETVYGTRKRLGLVAEVLEEYRNACGLPPGDVRVLDVGCGTGSLLTFPLALAGYRIIGIDVDEPSVRLYASQRPKQASLIVGDVLSLAESRSFDVIICSEVLEHLSDPRIVLAKLAGLLRPGGRLIVTVPNGYGAFEWEEVLWKRLGFFVLDRLKQYYQAVRLRVKRRQFRQFFRRGLNADVATSEFLNTLHHSPHLQFFTVDEVVSLLSTAGFKVLAVFNLSFLSGKITHTLFGGFPWFVRWTTGVANQLPSSICSNWLFVCED